MIKKHHSEETRKKMSDAKRGKQLTEEHKHKLSESHKGKHPSEKIRNSISATLKKEYAEGKRISWNKGKHNIYSEKTLRQMANSRSVNSKINPNYGMKGKRHSKEAIEKLKLARATRVLPFKDTSIEVKVQQELISRGIPFQKHFPVFGQPDIAFPDKKIAIFCDGNYWHNLPKQKERDSRVNENLRSNGWIVLRYWENEINISVNGCVDNIEQLLNRVK